MCTKMLLCRYDCRRQAMSMSLGCLHDDPEAGDESDEEAGDDLSKRMGVQDHTGRSYHSGNDQ